MTAFSGALFLLVLALVRGNDDGWSSGLIVSLFAGAGALLAVFIVIEHRVSEPMLPLGLFRKAAFTGVQLAAFAISCSMLSLFLYLTLYLQNHLGHTPFETGLRYLPITMAAFVVAPVAGALLSRLPARVIIGAGLAAAGVGLLLMSGIEATSEWTTLLGGFLVAGVGIGLLNPAIADVAVSVVPKEQSGMAGGINDTFRQVGIAVGTAAWGAVLVGRGADRVGELAAGTPLATSDHPRQLVEAASSGGLNQAIAAVSPPAKELAANVARQGFLAGLNAILVMGAAVSFAGAVLAIWLIREHEIQRHTPEREPETHHGPVERLGDQPQAVNAVASQRPVSRPAVSQRLMVLRHARLQASLSPGDRHVHSLEADGISPLGAPLNQVWSSSLAAYKAAAERRTRTWPG